MPEWSSGEQELRIANGSPTAPSGSNAASPLRQRGNPGVEIDLDEAVKPPHAKEHRMRPFLNATFLNATFLSNIEAQLRWLWLAAGALLWLGIPTAAAAPSRSRADGSSVLWLTVTDQLLWWQAPLWLTWPILFRCHLLCLVVGVGSLYRVRHTDPGRCDPLNMDPSCKGLAPVLMMHATMENGNTDSCHECCAPLSLGYTHCPMCKACIRWRWWHCCLMGVCIGAGNRRQYVLQ